MTARHVELVCPAGTPASFRAAVDAGADAVYCGFNDETNARNFPGLNFSPAELEQAIGYAHARRTKVFVAINTFPRAGSEAAWHDAVNRAATLRADAAIVADIGLLAYAVDRQPGLRLHLSVQAAAASADSIGYYVEKFGVKRVVLPRVLTVAEIASLNRTIACETEAFVFGGLCVMAEGRCAMSSYVTGRSPNMNGVCSPPSHVRYTADGGDMISRLGAFTINRVRRGQPSPYPTLCKGTFRCGSTVGNIFEEPASLDASALIPALADAGVSALKIEGRQRSRSYIETVVREFHLALDRHAKGEQTVSYGLAGLTEGQRTTQGSYRKTWR